MTTYLIIIHLKCTFFELFEKYVELCVFKNEVARVLVELTQGLEGGVVIWVDQGEVLDVQNCHDILARILEHRDTREAWKHKTFFMLSS